jgi:phage baseplate assembly protein W
LNGLKLDPITSTTQNQIVLRTSWAIPGTEGSVRLEVPAFRLDEVDVPEEVRAWSVTTGERVSRGMGYLSQPTGTPIVPVPEPFAIGLLRPFQRIHADLRSGQGITEILSNVGQVLGTIRGSLPWRTEFGSSLETLRHQANTPVLQAMATVYVDDALRRWEPRALLTRVDQMEREEFGESTIAVRALLKISLFEQASTYPVNISLKSNPRGATRRRISPGGGSGENPGEVGSSFMLTGVFPYFGVHDGGAGFLFQNRDSNSSYFGPLILQFSNDIDPETLDVVFAEGSSSPPAPSSPGALFATFSKTSPAQLPLTFTVVGSTIEIRNSAPSSSPWGAVLSGGGGELYIQLTSQLRDVDGTVLGNPGDSAYWLYDSDD